MKKSYKYDYPENRKVGKEILSGERKLIADTTTLSVSYVSDVLNGKRRNEHVINVAKDLIALRDIAIEKHKIENKG